MAKSKEERAAWRIADRLMNSGQYTAARQAYTKAGERFGYSPYVAARMAESYLEQRRWKSACRCAETGLEWDPDDPLVLYVAGHALHHTGEQERAEALLRRLLSWSEWKIGTWETGHGDEWARSLKNDCRFVMGIIKDATGDRVAAKRWFRLYLKHYGGVRWSDFLPSDARERIEGGEAHMRA
jgi:tetratricopeptide (TPR) repeat protein